MRYRTPLATVSIVIALVAVACSSGSGDAASPTTVPPVSTTAAQDGSGTPDTVPDTTMAPTTTVVSNPVFAGADPITQTTPTSGGGLRPLLEWDAVDSAALYFVTIYTEDGAPYWSAVTAETSTFVGGPLQIPEGRSGPIVVEGFNWTVVAEDVDGNMLAASPTRPIAP